MAEFVDPHYLVRLESKGTALSHKETAVRGDLSHTHQELLQVSEEVRAQLKELKKELMMVESEMRVTIERVKNSIGRFRNVIKKGDLARLQNRIDVWNPQGKITREQFKRMLAD